MGYTHYFPQQRDFTDTEWTALGDASRAIIAKSGVQIVREFDQPDEPPEIDGEYVIFNGAGEDGHETFLIRRLRVPEFDFCKTAEKPYDVVVVAILIASDVLAPGALDISSDGHVPDWQAGLVLATQAGVNAATVPTRVKP